MNHYFVLKPTTIATLALCIAAMAAFGQSRPSPIVTKAGADFDKVDAAPIPNIQDAMSCVQSNAAAVAAVRPDERYLYQFRKGYCELFGAVLTGTSDGFRAAASDFTDAVFSWPLKTVPGPPSALAALISIAHLEQGRMVDAYPDLTREMESILAVSGCPATPIMSPAFCSDLLVTAKVWLGWLAYRKSDYPKAAQYFSASATSPWNSWIAGRIAQQEKRPTEAAEFYRKALDGWAANEKDPNPNVVTLLGPKPDSIAGYYELGVMDFEAGRFAAAIPRFDAVIKAAPKNSYAIFLRARSKDGLQQYTAAIDDYALAVQTARTYEDSSWNIGQAYYHRGLLLYREKDFARAESEFGNAITAAAKEIPVGDLNAWRTMAQVSGSDCGGPLDALESNALASSDQFPKAEAAALVIDCRLKKAMSLEDFLAHETRYAGVLQASKLRDLRNTIAAAYADQGVAAEDRKDPAAAIAAYRHSIEYNPVSPKAHFNLGAIYIEGKSYDLAEAEYRALVAADANDFEAQYWLGQSILAQRPAPERVAEACGFLRRAVAVADPQRKAQYTKALTAAKCQN